jgi:hypothetical protein
MSTQKALTKWAPDLSQPKKLGAGARLPAVINADDGTVFGKPFDVSDFKLDQSSKGRSRNDDAKLANVASRPDLHLQHDNFSRAPNSGQTRSIGVGSSLPKELYRNTSTPSVPGMKNHRNQSQEESQVDITDEVSNPDKGSISDYRPLQQIKMSQSRYTTNMSTGLEDSTK